MIVSQLIAAYLGWLSRHRAPNTIQFYRSRLQSFLVKFADRQFAPLAADCPTGISPLHIDEFLFHAGFRADGRALSDSTKRHGMVALEALQCFGLKNKLMPARIFERLEKPRMGARERIATDAEIKRLLRDAPPAFRLLFTALSQTGCRPSELCGLMIEDVLPIPGNEESSGFRAVIELKNHKTARKTGKPRLIPIGKKFARLLWLAIGDRKTGPAFLNSRGTAWSPDALGTAYRRLRDAAGLPRDMCLYLARHGFATLQLESGQDIKTVADLMGHSSVKTVEKYLHRDVATLRGEQDRI